MNYFEGFKLYIPELWTKEWDVVISDAEGISKEILKVQYHAAQFLEQIDDFKVTPEKLAWLAFWTRIFSSLEAVLLALANDSEYILRIISRAVFEDSLHAQLLLKESSPSVTNISDRLSAYAAWCLWNDRKVYQDILSNLEGIWSSSPVNDIATRPYLTECL